MNQPRLETELQLLFHHAVIHPLYGSARFLRFLAEALEREIEKVHTSSYPEAAMNDEQQTLN